MIRQYDWKYLTCYRNDFLFNDTATTEIYTLSLHDALPIYHRILQMRPRQRVERAERLVEQQHFRLHRQRPRDADRKSTRLNSSHVRISYAVFCLKKKNYSAGGS